VELIPVYHLAVTVSRQANARVVLPANASIQVGNKFFFIIKKQSPNNLAEKSYQEYLK